MGLEVATSLVLLLVTCEHGHVEVAPSAHSVANEVKPLRLPLSILQGLPVDTGYAHKVGTSLSLQVRM